MAFVSPLKLSSVLSAYGLGATGNMNSLRGLTYVDISGTIYTVPASGNFQLFQTFNGKYAREETNSYPPNTIPYAHGGGDSSFGHIDTNIHISEFLYTTVGSKFVSLAVGWYRDGTVNSYNNTNYNVTFDGTSIYSNTDNDGGVLNFSTSKTGISCSTIVLNLSHQSSDGYGTQASVSGIWTFTIDGSGNVQLNAQVSN
jgi:hypothetical protein